MTKKNATIRRVQFEYNSDKASSVFLVGDFNAWNQKKHEMKENGDGAYRKTLMLPPGAFEYKFLVDGLLSASLFTKSFDLVLLHGCTNRHQWSDAFLSKCAELWGSGNVYVIYTNSSKRYWTRTINSRVIRFCGENDFTAGGGFVWDQSALMRTKILKLQASYGLSSKFNVIAHSMGGLVSRYYAKQYPYTMAGLVTLGTPHHGSAFATAADLALLGRFVGAEDALQHMVPSWVNNTFNVTLAPINSTPLADSQKVWTIVGDAHGWRCWGWGGELFAGWPILRVVEGHNDGLVSHQSAMLSGIDNHNGDANTLGFFWRYNHKDLVEKADVATKASSVLR